MFDIFFKEADVSVTRLSFPLKDCKNRSPEKLLNATTQGLPLTPTPTGFGSGQLSVKGALKFTL